MDIQLQTWFKAEEIVMPIRIEVFVKEQSVPEDLERDEHDVNASHALLIVDGQTIGDRKSVV